MIHNRWQGETVAVIASGPSAREVDVDMLKGRARVIAVNDSHKLCPWADMMYAADQRWWQHHEYVLGFKGERWTQQQGKIDWPDEAKQQGIHVMQSANKPGISFAPDLIHTGINSGFQALNLAVLQGASRVLLLGVDLTLVRGRRHWFGDHPRILHRDSPYSIFRQTFVDAAPQLLAADIKVVNCSPVSALNCFPRMTVEEALS